MGLNDEDEDLVALRLAALSTMKAKRASENAMKLKHSSVGGVSIRDNFGNKNNALFQPHFNSNLIAIVPISPSTETEQPRTRRAGFRHQQPESNKLILPQHRYCKTEEVIQRKKEKPAVKTKFNRYDSSSSDSSEESEDEGSTASGETAAKTPAEDRLVRDDIVARDEPDSEPEPSFFVELERDEGKKERDDATRLEREDVARREREDASRRERDDVARLERDDVARRERDDVARRERDDVARREREDVARREREDVARRERDDVARRERDDVARRERDDVTRRERDDVALAMLTMAPVSAFGIGRGSQETQRVPSPPPAANRSPSLRYPPRSRSKSPPPFYSSCRPYADRSRSRSRSRSRPRLGRSRSPRRYGPRRSPSPKRRAASPTRYSPPRRRSPSPLPPRRRPSSPRRRSSPFDRLSPLRRRSSPFDRLSPPRRRSSPWRRYSPSPRRLSPRRRKSPSPVKRNPSPPRRFSPQRRSPLGRRVSPPRRNPSPPRKLYPVGGGRSHSPRRYPSPPPSPRRYNTVGDMSPWSPPRNCGPRSVSPPSPRPLPFSPNDHGKRRRGASPPRRRGSVSPLGGRRKSVSPPRKGPASPRFAPKRRRSFSPRGARPGSKKRSPSPGPRIASSPVKSRRLEERDSRTAVRGLRDATTTTATTTAVGRDNSKSLSLSPPPDRVKVKSPLRVRAHRHERANGKKRTKSKKSRDKASVPSAEKTEKTGEKSAVIGEKSAVIGEKSSVTGEKSSVLEARRKKFESVDPIRPVNKKIRLKTNTEEPLAVLPPVDQPATSPCATEEGERPDTPDETVDEAVETVEPTGDEEDDDALVLDEPSDLWSDEESDSGNEGRFKWAPTAPRIKVPALSFRDLLQPSARPTEPRRARDRTMKERRAPARENKRRRDRGSANKRPAGSVLDRIGERGAAWGRGKEADVADRLPALLSKEISKPEPTLKSSDVSETAPDPTDRVSRPDSTDRVSRLDSTDQHGDLRAALSRKRAARSNILFPFKGGDKGKVPGSRLVQSAFLDAVGKKQKRSKKSQPQRSLLQMVNNVAGGGKDARRVTLYNKVKASVKQLSESVTLATDESTLTTETHFSDDETSRKPPVRLRLGLPQHGDDYPGGRKVKLKRNNNNNNAAGDQV